MNKGPVLCVILMLLAVPSTLSSNVQQAMLDTTQLNSSPLPKNSSFVSLYDNVTTHEGDLIINGTQAFVIENCAYKQMGDIFVEDWGNLSLKDATLVLMMQYDHQYNIYIEDDATAKVENSKVEAAEYWVGSFRLSERAQANIENSTLDNMGIVSYRDSVVTIENSTFSELIFWDSSQVLIINSSVAWTVTLTFYSPNIVHLDGLHAGRYENWNLHMNETVQNVPCDLTLRNTVLTWGLTLRDDAVANVSNSEVESIRLLLNHETNIENLHPGHYEEWVFNSMTFSNITVGNHWFLGVENTIASVRNSYLRIGARGNSSISIALHR